MIARKKPLPRSTLEKDWRAQVLQLAALYGWRCFYVEQSTRWSEKAKRRIRNINVGGEGFPDLVLVRHGHLIFAELKRDLGPHGGGEDQHVNPTTEQSAWLVDLQEVAHNCVLNVAVYLWRPADLPDVQRILWNT